MNAIRSDVTYPFSPESISLLRHVETLLSSVDEMYLVGGFLRDSILGRATRDIDIAFQGDAIAAARQLADSLGGTLVVLDQPRQIARVVIDSEDRSLLPDKPSWHFDLATLQGDLYSDLARRDFTIDAMALPLGPLLEGVCQSDLIDPFGGQRDLVGGLIRAVSPEVFREDGARLLRAIRLAASLKFELERETKENIKRDAETICSVSAERVRDEFLAILATTKSVDSIYLMDDLGLMTRLLPELDAGRNVVQPKEHYWDVFRHNIETVGTMEQLTSRTLEPHWVLDEVMWDRDLEQHFSEVVTDGHTRGTLCKLAGLLHDVAKPVTKTIEESGRIRFFGHHSQGAEIAGSALKRLRLSSRGVHMVEAMIDLHLRPGQMSQGVELPTPRAIYRYFRRAGDIALDTLYLNLADYIAARGPYLERDEWRGYAGMVMHIMNTGSEQQQAAGSFGLLNGHDVMSFLGIQSGPKVGRLLNAVNEAQAAGGIETRTDALDLIQEEAQKLQGGGANA